MRASLLQGEDSLVDQENHCRGILQKLFYRLFVKKVESNWRHLVRLCIWVQIWLALSLWGHHFQPRSLNFEMKKVFLLGFIPSPCFPLPPGIHVQQSIIPDIYIYEHISGNLLVSAFTKHMINISLLKNKNLSSAVGDQFCQRYNLCFGGYFYDGIYDGKRPPELPWVEGSFTMS